MYMYIYIYVYVCISVRRKPFNGIDNLKSVRCAIEAARAKCTPRLFSVQYPPRLFDTKVLHPPPPSLT